MGKATKTKLRAPSPKGALAKQGSSSSRGPSLTVVLATIAVLAAALAAWLNNSSTPGSLSTAQVGDKVNLTVVNNWREAVSLMWLRTDEDWELIALSIGSGAETPLETTVGHRFVFTQVGNQMRIGEIFTVEPGVERLELAADAQRRADIEGCEDRFPAKCESWATAGECEKNPGWMIINCPMACRRCDLLDAKKRCDRDFLNISAADDVEPGALGAMFERALEELPGAVALSRPPEGPWVLQIDDFLTDAEVDAMIKWGYKLGFERSTDVGETNERGEMAKIVSQQRTSSNTWCPPSTCEADPVIDGALRKVEALTGIPRRNYEQYKLLKYTEGQYYKTHHDLITVGQEACGPRMLTFFQYLSDVEDGGETEFPDVQGGIKVSPKRGRAIMWPSVLDEDPGKQEPNTRHAALAVKKGTKYGSNLWIHRNDFRKPYLWLCTGG